MKYFVSLVSLFSLFFLYQNCAGPIRDLNEPGSKDACLKETQEVGFNINEISDLKYEVTLEVPDSQVDRAEWLVNDSPADTSFGNSKTFNFPEAGQYQVRALAYRDDCAIPQFHAMADIDATPANCDSTPLSISTETQSMALEDTKEIQLENASSLQATSIRWKVNGVENSDFDSLSTIIFDPSDVGSFEIQASAIRSGSSGCGSVNSNTLTIDVNDGPVINTTAELRLDPSDGKCSVNEEGAFQCTVTAKIRNINQLANGHVLKLHNKTLLDDADYTKTVLGCFTGDKDISMGWIPLGGRFLEVFVDTSGECAAYESEEQMAENLIPLNIGKTARAFCGVNKYVTSGSCENVGNGKYSPDKNNNRNSCTNPKPSNSHYSGPGDNGENNCPWSCNSGYERDGEECVEPQGDPCPSTTISRCSLPSANHGDFQNGSCSYPYQSNSCSASCQDGNWSILMSCSGQIE